MIKATIDLTKALTVVIPKIVCVTVKKEHGEVVLEVQCEGRINNHIVYKTLEGAVAMKKLVEERVNEWYGDNGHDGQSDNNNPKN